MRSVVSVQVGVVRLDEASVYLCFKLVTLGVKPLVKYFLTVFIDWPKAQIVGKTSEKLPRTSN
ncbi:hypothetical protein [Kordiimonas sediminis]|uniref:hypothetical protein n=1 Tax=Kordiimonas sediminis TaxID=1735581 RepID=UPI00174DBCA9|nr:hypothetical protein [Kordiimonas sediminis]